jgi:protein-S-isoprenylcysteine O-methyltransferase Ste14
MIEPLAVTLPPALFLVVLFGGGALLRRRDIDMDGTAPIHKPTYLAAKYSIIALWATAACQSWGLRPFPITVPGPLAHTGLGLWLFGFALMFTGRFGLGDSFRIGSAKETTRLRVNGLFRFSRNPMYVGVFATLTGATLYTLNPAVLLIAAFVIAVHHRIVLAEEEHLRSVFGQEYVDYCCRVRRYL